MRIPIIYIPKTRYKYFIEIKRNYKAEKYIIPIGKDCHAAHSLEVLNIRIQSLPYDWIRLKPIMGLKIVSDNIKERFKYFLHDFRKNEDGNTYAKKYPDAEFTHAKAVISDSKLKKTFEKRYQRMLKIIKIQPVAYLYILDISGFKTSEDVDFFCDTINGFRDILKQEDSLHIYIRFDEEISNNKICNSLLLQVKQIPQVHITTYIRQKARFGIWGNEKEYPKLYKNLNLMIKETFPKFSLITP